MSGGGLTTRRDLLLGSTEQFDSRFVGSKGTIEKSSQPAQPKISIEEMKLDKPKSLKEKGEQPIPLEYQEQLR